MQSTKHILISLTLIAVTGSLFAQPAQRSWSGTTARQFIHRYADPDEIRWGTQDNSFTWQAGYLMFALEHLWRWTGDPVYFDYIRRYVDQNVDAEGHLRQFRPDALDNFLPGYACLLLYEQTGQERYAHAAETIRRGFDGRSGWTVCSWGRSSWPATPARWATRRTTLKWCAR